MLTREKTNGTSARVVMEGVRRDIVNGVLRPGQQLPTRVELEEKFNASTLTVQRALDSLLREQFVRVNGRRGTYVTDNPPHLTRYALVFRACPSSAEHHWSRFYAALQSESLALQEPSGRQIATYTGIDGHIDNEKYQQLLEEVQCHRVAGVIFGDGPEPLANTPLLKQREVPMVSIQGKAPVGVPVVTLDHEGFMERAFKHFAQRQRKRLAVLSPSPTSVERYKELEEMAGRYGLTTRNYWHQSCALEVSQGAINLMQLLFSHPDNRPDCLLITDDNLVPEASEGLVAAGVRVPDELEVVAHGNFPYLTPSMVRATRLGFYCRDIVQVCLQDIDCRRRNLPRPELTPIAAMFEEEVKIASSYRSIT